MYTTSNTANSSSIMGPAGLPLEKILDRARQPAPNSVVPRPNYILINTTGSFSFSNGYNTTFTEGDIVNCTDFNYTVPIALTSATLGVKTALPIKLELQPVAWSSGSVANKLEKGDVTFVYTGRF